MGRKQTEISRGVASKRQKEEKHKVTSDKHKEVYRKQNDNIFWRHLRNLGLWQNDCRAGSRSPEATLTYFIKVVSPILKAKRASAHQTQTGNLFNRRGHC